MSRDLYHAEPRRVGISPAEVEALLERILESTAFAHSTRSQEVLRYLCRSVLNSPGAKITEHQIGVSVFGWDPDRDSGHDTIVRVQISQLRKRLDQYFSSEGLNDPIGIRLPKGSYSPIFEIRDLPVEEQRPRPVPVAQVQAPPPRRRRFVIPLLVAANLAAVALAIGFGPWFRGSGGEAVSTNLDRFWKPFRGRPSQVVLSDGTLLVTSEMLGRDIDLHEYRSHFDRAGVVRASSSDEGVRELAGRVLLTHMTGTQDVDVFGLLSSLLGRYRIPVSSTSAQDFNIPTPDNVILLGNSRVNPWMHLFDDRLNFQYRFDWTARKGQIVNMAPQPGEDTTYTADFGKHGYCVVACLPKPVGEGTAVLIYGSDLSSLEAGGRFVTDEQWMKRLYGRLNATASNDPMYVEVLLRTELLDGVAQRFDIAAWRLHNADLPKPGDHR